VSFLPLDLTNPDSIETVLSHIDFTMQYGEDEEPKEVRRRFCPSLLGRVPWDVASVVTNLQTRRSSCWRMHCLIPT
jgi:hypothetical protein